MFRAECSSDIALYSPPLIPYVVARAMQRETDDNGQISAGVYIVNTKIP